MSNELKTKLMEKSPRYIYREIKILKKPGIDSPIVVPDDWKILTATYLHQESVNFQTNEGTRELVQVAVYGLILEKEEIVVKKTPEKS